MGHSLKLATKAFMATGALVLAASCSSTPQVYSVVPTQKPTQEEIAMLTQLQATDTTALASPDTVAQQTQPIDMATDRTIAMAYAIPQPKPAGVTNDAAQAIDSNIALATPVDGTKVKTRSIEIAAVDPTILQLQPSTETNDNGVTANAMVETNTKNLEPFVSSTKNTNLNQLIAKYSALYDVPEPLVHHVVRRESNYNPSAVHKGNWGLMQIRYNTAKGMGYDGSPTGLLDAETNLKYAVKYLKGAWIVAEKDAKKADWLYRTGYYYQAKRKGLLDEAGLQ
ncbi:transglycosylase SLT domain-containing protein [Rhizobium sp.]